MKTILLILAAIVSGIVVNSLDLSPGTSFLAGLVIGSTAAYVITLTVLSINATEGI